MAGFLYRCFDCKAAYERDTVQYLCPVCEEKNKPGEPLRGVLLAEFDYPEIARCLDPRNPDWDLFSAVEKEFFPPFAVGRTPMVPSERLAQALGVADLRIKNDGLNPTGSLKDRASHLVVAEAVRLNEDCVVTASTGNAGVALAAACAAAKKEAIIFVPASAPRAKLLPMVLHGAKLVRIRGTYDDAFRLSLEYTRTRGGLNRNTAYNPLTIEGKKTAALEIFEQCGRAPDAVIVPTGDGVILAGVYKGFKDLCKVGRIDRLPRLVCVQAKASDAIHHLVTTGTFRSAPAPDTVADSLSVSVPANAWMAAWAVKKSKGFSITVTDKEILEGQALLARTTGIFAEPAAAAAVAGLKKAAARDWLRDGLVVLLITGHGLKDVDAPLKGMRLPAPKEPDLSKLEW